jgi:predicted metalloprotease
VNRLVRAAVVAASVALLLAGCTNAPENKPTSAPSTSAPPNPFQVAGMPVTNGPSGLRPGAPGSTRPVEDGDGGEIDGLAAMAVADIEQFWADTYAGFHGSPWDELRGKFTPVNSVFSWDSRYKNGTFCGMTTGGGRGVNATYCDGLVVGNCPDDVPSPPAQCTQSDNTIGWDRGVLLPQQRTVAGDMGDVVVLAHEYGHAIQRMAGLVREIPPNAPMDEIVAVGTVKEQQADCFAGVYMRWVAEGKSTRFTLSTGDGLSKLLTVLIGTGDPLLLEADPAQLTLEHGSAFERVSAFQFGFTDGVSACAGINETDIAQRRANLPKEFLQQGTTGEVPVSNESVTSLTEALTKLFSPATPPKLGFEQQPCPDARPSPAASYCPSSNTITVDVPRLIVMGTSLARGSPFPLRGGPLFGDYTAYSVVVSRYMLAVQKERGGLSLDNTDAGLRTACLTGVATSKFSKGVVVSNGDTIALTGGDLDEAVSGLLTPTNGLAAGDVNGQSAPSAFARIDAFRTGVLGDENGCLKRWP